MKDIQQFPVIFFIIKDDFRGDFYESNNEFS